MYEAFYGFRDSPFRLTPDPDYLFLSANHREGLAHLLFGVNEGSGVVVITGAIGTGKTTLLRTLIRNLDEHTPIAYIFNPTLSPLELLQTINAELGLPAASASRKELIDYLNRFLLAERTAGRRVVVIIDEAQNLEPAVLEQLRLLSNLETEREKLLQIILAGQPELDAVLAQPELAQLDQRITLRWYLRPLTADETGAYVRHRIRITSGGRAPVQFTPRALRTVYRSSRGVPRVINLLCHRALLISYTREERTVSWSIARQAVGEVHKRQRGSAFFSRPALVTSAAIATLVVMSLFAGAALRDRMPSFGFSGSENAGVQAPTPAAAEATPTPEAARDKSREDAVPVASIPSVATLLPSSPSSAPPPQRTEAFLQELQHIEFDDSAVRAIDGLLRAWETSPLHPSEWKHGELDFGTIARARGLEYYQSRGTFHRIARLNLPVIMELTLPDQREKRFITLLSVTGDRCRVLLEQEYDIPIQRLTDNWSGRSHLFWRDFVQLGPHMSVGSVGNSVKQLHTLLAEVKAFEGIGMPTADRAMVFSQETAQAVIHFQRARQLVPDGIVGPLTLITLYNTVPAYAHPRLGIVTETALTAEQPRSPEREAGTNNAQTPAGEEGT